MHLINIRYISDLSKILTYAVIMDRLQHGFRMGS